MTGITKVTNKFNKFLINLLGGVTLEDKDKEVAEEVRKTFDSCEGFAIEHMKAKCGNMLLTEAHGVDWGGDVVVAVSRTTMTNCIVGTLLVAPWAQQVYLSNIISKDFK